MFYSKKDGLTRNFLTSTDHDSHRDATYTGGPNLTYTPPSVDTGGFQLIQFQLMPFIFDTQETRYLQHRNPETTTWKKRQEQPLFPHLLFPLFKIMHTEGAQTGNARILFSRQFQLFVTRQAPTSRSVFVPTGGTKPSGS